jgi:hypothetical protein
VFTCILASSRITRSGSWKTDPSFLRGFCHRLVRFLWLTWRIIFLLILYSLSDLIRCGLFFTVAISPQYSLLFLLLFVRSSFFARVMISLMLSLISSLLFGVRLTLLVLSSLLPLVSHAMIRWLLLSFIARMTS